MTMREYEEGGEVILLGGAVGCPLIDPEKIPSPPPHTHTMGSKIMWDVVWGVPPF